MKTKILRTTALGLSVVFLASGLIYAQAGRGTAFLSGNVTDEEGNPLEGAQVTLSFVQGGGGVKQEALTDKKGEWSFLGLGTGQWNLAVVMKGFEPSAQAVTISQLSRNAKVWIKLKKIIGGADGAVLQDEDSLVFLDEGNQYYKDGDYDEAIARYELFLEKNPKAYQVQVNIADAYKEKGDYEKAKELYDKIIDLSANDATLGREVSGKAYAGIGDIFLKQNKLAEAQEYFRRSIERSPKDEVLAYNVGEIYFSNQNLPEAKKYFELAMQIRPEWPDPYLKMGYVFLNTGDNEGAIEMFEKFLTLETEGERATMVHNVLSALKK